jgi:hypothetical protein
MAVQAHGKKPGLQVVRTPAPKQDLKTGGEDYGEANAPDTPSSVPPGVGGPMTKLGQNLRDSVDDDVIGQVIAGGIAGRGDKIPADGSDQLREVSAESYPAAHGMKSPNLPAGKFNALPEKLGDNSAAPVRKPD